MPHGGKPDGDVEQIYGILEEQCDEAKKRGFRTILAGDFNAEVGARGDFDDPEIIGPSVFPYRSERGLWLMNWCSFHGLKIATRLACIARRVLGHTGMGIREKYLIILW